MNNRVIDRVRSSLLDQRQNITQWLHSTSPHERQIRLGPANEQAVQAHLQVLDAALEKAENQTLGICEVCHDTIDASRLEMDYTACICLDHLAAEEKRRLEFELELSQKVQQALLPQEVPSIPGLNLAAFSQPAHIVSGDYFDFFHFRDDTHGLVIGDVVDKGMPASLLMASLQASLRILIADIDSLAEVAQRLNELFIHNIRLTQFVTLFLSRYDPVARTLQYCNAGHNPPLLYRKTQDGAEEIQWLQPTGAAIGLVEMSQFKSEVISLLPGDVLVLYTDGVTEARNPQAEEFTTTRLVDFVRQHADQSPADLMHDLRRALQEFTQGSPLADDTTIVAGRLVS